ncbi:MAG: GntG family PLP-dependent aldolase [Bacteroidota bacterium]
MVINLLSDTVTKPSAGMLEAMMAAEVGDDVFGEDPSVNDLQTLAASMFGHEAALFCPSGTMTNQIGISMHTSPLDEVICDHYSHVYQYETGGYAYNARVAMNLIKGEHGKITADQIQAHIRPDYDWLPKSSLVVLENSCNKGGGSYYTIDEIKPIHHLCRKHGLKLHLDGARLFNVLVETEESTEEVGSLFDSISICLSKGLGAPVGSLLIGSAADIKKARRLRKVMGGGMRQAGYLAAAGIYALNNHIPQLKVDNDRAKTIAAHLRNLQKVTAIRPVKTNILIFSVAAGARVPSILSEMKAGGVVASQFGPSEIRFVTHREIQDHHMDQIFQVCRSCLS